MGSTSEHERTGTATTHYARELTPARAVLKSLLDGVSGEDILPGVWSSRISLLSLLIL